MLDVKEERKFEELRRITRLLHIPMPEAFWTLEVFDKDGKLLQRYHTRSHSWTRNAYNMIFIHLAGKEGDDGTYEAGKLSYKETDATIISGNAPGWVSAADAIDGNTLGYRAPGGEDLWGIIVGSGVNVESFEDFTLQTQMGEGTGAGEISHVASEVHAISYAGLVLKNELIRYFNNNSAPAGDRGINEVGLVWNGDNMSGQPLKYFLTVRDKLGSTVTVPNTGQCKVTYTIQLTYPS